MSDEQRLQQNQPPDPPAQPKQHPGDFIDPTGLEAETAENAVAVVGEEPAVPVEDPQPKRERKPAPKKRPAVKAKPPAKKKK